MLLVLYLQRADKRLSGFLVLLSANFLASGGSRPRFAGLRTKKSQKWKFVKTSFIFGYFMNLIVNIIERHTFHDLKWLKNSVNVLDCLKKLAKTCQCLKNRQCLKKLANVLTISLIFSKCLKNLANFLKKLANVLETSLIYSKCLKNLAD